MVVVKRIKHVENDGYTDWYSITIDNEKWLTTSEYGIVVATGQVVDNQNRPLTKGDYETQAIRRAIEHAQLRGEV